MKLRDLHAFDEKIEVLEQEIESLLLQTNGRLLLTVPGMGVYTSAELFAEMGNVSHFTHAGQLIKKTVTNPIIKQTGVLRAPTDGFPSRETIISVMWYFWWDEISVCISTDLKTFYLRLKARGKHERAIFIAMGNKMLKIALAMLRDQLPFFSQITKSPRRLTRN